MKAHSFLPWLFLLLLLVLTACGAPAMEEAMEEPAAQQPSAATAFETAAVEVEKEAEEAVVEEPAIEEPLEAGTGLPQPTATLPIQPTSPAASPTPVPTQVMLPPTPIVEPRIVEVEWPNSLYLGDSDVVRMALIPTQDGYTVTTEFPDHQTLTQDVPVIRPEGYELYGVGRLYGVGFDIAPEEDQVRSLPLNESVTWHWSLTPQQPGKQRITLTLLLRWIPITDPPGLTREAVAYSKGLEIQVRSFFGLSRGQAMIAGLAGAVFGSGMSLYALFSRSPGKARKTKGLAIREGIPNREISIEYPAGLTLSLEEHSLLQCLFASYSRLVIRSEFLSGYSGARTLLVLPIRPDGRSDAYTIAKIGSTPVIQQEYKNYQTFVKHTLPPVTARIQKEPVTLPAPGRKEADRLRRAALQYTFIGEPGSTPTSLRQSLLADPNPALLRRLFDTFGPNWWMQRRPFAFRLAQVYDRVLPPHFIIEPEPDIEIRREGPKTILDGSAPLSHVNLRAGDRVRLIHFESITPRPDGKSLSMKGVTIPGQPPLRLHWMGNQFTNRMSGRVIATREDMLRSYVSGFDLFGLPDPLQAYPLLLEETVVGTRSIIHGDLNLENVLVGPGDLVWLIDFATTREGHPLADFAHLEAEIIAHVIAARVPPTLYQAVLAERDVDGQLQGEGGKNQENRIAGLPNDVRATIQLRDTMFEIATKCLSNPSHPREYHLALILSCLGALKYRNLEQNQKHLLYLTAASLVKTLTRR